MKEDVCAYDDSGLPSRDMASKLRVQVAWIHRNRDDTLITIPPSKFVRHQHVSLRHPSISTAETGKVEGHETYELALIVQCRRSVALPCWTVPQCIEVDEPPVRGG